MKRLLIWPMLYINRKSTMRLCNSFTALAKTRKRQGTVRRNCIIISGILLLAMEKTDESIEAYKKSLRNRPTSEQTKYNLEFARHKQTAGSTESGSEPRIRIKIRTKIRTRIIKTKIRTKTRIRTKIRIKINRIRIKTGKIRTKTNKIRISKIRTKTSKIKTVKIRIKTSRIKMIRIKTSNNNLSNSRVRFLRRMRNVC